MNQIIKAFFLFTLTFGLWAQAKTVATFQKKGEKKVQNISLRDAQRAYKVVSQATLNTPSKNKFMKDYIRYHVALKEAYSDQSLITTDNIQNLIVNRDLKKGFEELLYQVYAASQLDEKVKAIESSVRQISPKNLQNYYAQNPYVKFSFIVFTLPSLASKKQLETVETRSQNIYQTVRRSKKPFPELIQLYSDNSNIGNTNQMYSRSTLYPLLYDRLKQMRPGQLSQPVKTPNGIYILRLNEFVPFSQANQNDLKEQIYNTQRAEIFNNHFDQLLAQYVIKIDSKSVSSL